MCLTQILSVPVYWRLSLCVNREYVPEVTNDSLLISDLISSAIFYPIRSIFMVRCC